MYCLCCLTHKNVLRYLSFQDNRSLSEAKTAIRFHEQDSINQMEEMARLEECLKIGESELETIRESLKCM